MTGFDARAVANHLLDLADREGRGLTNLVLQKLVYFAHGRFLTKTGNLLVGGEFEAWQYGPVHPHVYNAFKNYGAQNITERARSIDPVSCEWRELPQIVDQQALAIIGETYGHLKDRSASSLVALSHAKNAPWQLVVSRVNRRESVSLRISNDVIRERFRYHAVMLTTAEEAGVPNENSPFA